MKLFLILATFTPYVAATLPPRIKTSLYFILVLFLPSLASLFLKDSVLTVYPILTNIKIGIDETNLFFILFSNIIWLFATLYSKYYIVENRGRFFTFWYLTYAGCNGMILSLDLISFISHFTVMSFSAFMLIIHSEEKKSFFAGKVYIIFVIIGELLITFAAFWLTYYTKSFDLEVIRIIVEAKGIPNLISLLIFFGFGIKAGILLFHFWLPVAHPIAPTPASAILSAILVKTGILGWIRLLPSSFFNEELSFILLCFGIIGYIYSVAIGVTKNDEKVVLAYSTISQIHILLIGIVLVRNYFSKDIILYMINHAFFKSILFMIAPFLGRDLVNDKILIIISYYSILSLCGGSFTIGFLSKDQLKMLSDLPLISLFLSYTTFFSAMLMSKFLLICHRKNIAGSNNINKLIILILFITSNTLLFYISKYEENIYSITNILQILAAYILIYILNRKGLLKELRFTFKYNLSHRFINPIRIILTNRNVVSNSSFTHNLSLKHLNLDKTMNRYWNIILILILITILLIFHN